MDLDGTLDCATALGEGREGIGKCATAAFEVGGFAVATIGLILVVEISLGIQEEGLCVRLMLVLMRGVTAVPAFGNRSTDSTVDKESSSSYVMVVDLFVRKTTSQSLPSSARLWIFHEIFNMRVWNRERE